MCLRLLWALRVLVKVGAFARMGGKTLAYYIATSTISITIGLVFVSLFQPGLIDGEPAKSILGLHANTDEVASRVSDSSEQGWRVCFYVWCRLISLVLQLMAKCWD